MASNSTLAPNPLSSSWEGERYRLKPDQFAIATYDDNPSGPNLCIASPAAPRPQLRIDSWSATFLEDKTEQRSTAFSAREDDLFHESLVISGAKLRPLNPWAAVASVALLSLFLLALVVVPLLHTDVLPARERVTMLYMPSAGPVSNAISLPAPPAAFRSAPTKITRTKLSIPAPVHTTQEEPSPAEVAASGLVGGVPGGVAGGIPGGVLGSLVRDTASRPVLASTPPPATKRIRVPAPMAEANLVYDVAPKYPPEAGRARIEGTVVLMAVIGKDGTVRDVRVESGLPLLAQAAIDAVKQWRYRPYLLNGEPVEIDSQITINFNLSKG